jgi:cytochrome P450
MALEHRTAGASAIAPKFENPILAKPPQGKADANIFERMRSMKRNMLEIYRDRAYEEFFVEGRLLTKRYTLVSDPAAIKHILVEKPENYRKSTVMRRLFEPGFGQGLVTAEGPSWREHRRIMAPAFDHRSMVGYARVMTRLTDDLLQHWAEIPSGTVIDMDGEMRRLTLQIISQTMFSSDATKIAPIFEPAIQAYMVEVRPNLLDYLGFPDWIAGFGRARVTHRLLHKFDEAVHELIAERARAADNTRDKEHKDLLDRLISARDEETGAGLSPRQVRDEVVTIFGAGHETTALAMTWTLYLLSQHPAVEDKLSAELHRVLGGRSPQHEDLAALPYARMVIEESMRLYPPAHMIPREAVVDDVAGGQPIPKGSLAFIAPWIIHRHRKLWDDPERFEPERFSAERAAQRPRFAYLPFGGGPRICIGSAFAMMELTLILANLAQRFRFRLVPGHPVVPQGLITLHAQHGMKMTLEPRE